MFLSFPFCSESCSMLLLKPALFFVTWNDRTIMACTWASFHIFKWKDDTKMETEGPLGSSGVCGSDVKNKRSDVPSLSDCPRPTLHTPRGHRSPYQAPSSSDLTFPLCPGKRTLKTGHLSSLCCTVGLALCVERDWQHSAPFFGFCLASNPPWTCQVYVCLRPWSSFPLQVTSTCLVSLLSLQGKLDLFCVHQWLSRPPETNQMSQLN